MALIDCKNFVPSHKTMCEVPATSPINLNTDANAHHDGEVMMKD